MTEFPGKFYHYQWKPSAKFQYSLSSKGIKKKVYNHDLTINLLKKDFKRVIWKLTKENP